MSTDTRYHMFDVLDVLRAVCTYLVAREVTALSKCDKKLAVAIITDESIWQLICSRELSVNLNASLTTAVQQNLHKEVIYDDDSLMSWRETYLSWRSELKEFKNSEIYRAKSFWDRITAYFRKHDPADGGVIETLTCRKPGKRIPAHIPRPLRLLYSFYDGQTSLPKRLPSPLFGCYFMYGELECTFLFRSDEFHKGYFGGGEGKRIGYDSRYGGVYIPSFDGDKIYTASPTGDLFDWLDNFVSNLENKVFAFESLDMNQPTARKYRQVVTYPLLRGSDNSIPDSIRKYFSCAITNGIEIRFAYVFSPERSPESLYVYIYTIRMRLLADHPTRLPRMVSCRLLRRHWRIFDSATGLQYNY